MFTYEIAPVFILMENVCLAKMREIIGFQTGDSILAPGGSINNMYALMIARHKLYPQHKKHGMRPIKGQLIMYTSRHVSFTFNVVAKIAMQIGSNLSYSTSAGINSWRSQPFFFNTEIFNIAKLSQECQNDSIMGNLNGI